MKNKDECLKSFKDIVKRNLQKNPEVLKRINERVAAIEVKKPINDMESDKEEQE